MGAPYHVFGGSAIKQSFSGDVGNVLLFQWNYLTSDKDFAPGCCDFSFVVLDGSISLLGYFGSPLPPSSTSFFLYETGYQLFATTLATSGIHTVAFGVVQTYDDIIDSGILIDSVRVIPEPSSWLLLLSGFALLALSSRRPLRYRLQ